MRQGTVLCLKGKPAENSKSASLRHRTVPCLIPVYPQLLVLNRDTKRPVPQTEDNCDTAMVNPPKETQSGIAAFFARITKLFRSWITLLRTLFGALIG